MGLAAVLADIRRHLKFQLKLVQIQLRFTLIACDYAPENFMAAFRTYIPGFFVLNPFLGAKLPPIRNSPQHNLFADSHGKVFNMRTGEFITLMTPGVTFLFGAGLDLTPSAMHKGFIR